MMRCRCGIDMQKQEYGWRRACDCKSNAPYYSDQEPTPDDRKAWHQLTGKAIKRDKEGNYLYGAKK